MATSAYNAATVGLVAHDIEGSSHTGQLASDKIADNAIIASKIPASSVTTDKLAGGTYSWSKNLIANGMFNIAQRGTSFTADNAYSLDRWRLLVEGVNACTLTQAASPVVSIPSVNVCKMQVGAGTNYKFGIFQILEGVEAVALRGKTLTLSATVYSVGGGITYVKMAILKWAGTIDNGGTVFPDPISAWNNENVNPTLTTWQYISQSGTPSSLPITPGSPYGVSVSAAIPTDTNNLAVMIWSDDKTTTQTTDILYVARVQLEVGSNATEIEYTNAQADLARCLRYAYTIPAAPGVGGTYAVIAVGQCTGTTTGRFVIPLPVPMRAAPSLVQLGVGTVAVWSAQQGGGLSATWSIDSTSNSPNVTTLDGVTAGGIAAGYAAIARRSNTTDAAFVFTAEL